MVEKYEEFSDKASGKHPFMHKNYYKKDSNIFFIIGLLLFLYKFVLFLILIIFYFLLIILYKIITLCLPIKLVIRFINYLNVKIIIFGLYSLGIMIDYQNIIDYKNHNPKILLCPNKSLLDYFVLKVIFYPEFIKFGLSNKNKNFIKYSINSLFEDIKFLCCLKFKLPLNYDNIKKNWKNIEDIINKDNKVLIFFEGAITNGSCVWSIDDSLSMDLIKTCISKKIDITLVKINYDSSSYDICFENSYIIHQIKRIFSNFNIYSKITTKTLFHSNELRTLTGLKNNIKEFYTDGYTNYISINHKYFENFLIKANKIKIN